VFPHLIAGLLTLVSVALATVGAGLWLWWGRSRLSVQSRTLVLNTLTVASKSPGVVYGCVLMLVVRTLAVDWSAELVVGVVYTVIAFVDLSQRWAKTLFHPQIDARHQLARSMGAEPVRAELHTVWWPLVPRLCTEWVATVARIQGEAVAPVLTFYFFTAHSGIDRLPPTPYLLWLAIQRRPVDELLPWLVLVIALVSGLWGLHRYLRAWCRRFNY
jgi:hypothetical protein